MFSALHSLHTQRWREVGQSGVLADPRVLAWHREAIPQLLRAGLAQLACLQFQGEIVAALYSLLDPPERTARTQYCYLVGTSPSYAELSPGTLLLALTIDRAATQGIANIDLLRGNERYKQLWRPESIATTNISCSRAARPSQQELTTSSNVQS